MASSARSFSLAALAPEDRDDVADSAYATRYMSQPIPKNRLPNEGIPAPVAYQLIKDMRSLDSRPNLNVASFVTTWMEPEARQLIQESLDINFVNTAEYPSCTEMANRCVRMLACLYHAPSVDANGKGDAVGAPCVGSSEAIMLCGMAMKKRWAERRAAQGLDVSKPNLVMSAATHVCWEKFCRYWDVESRYVLADATRASATPELLQAKCDENTIGVVAILGTTYTGEFEDVEGIDAMVGRLNKANGWDVVVHVDGASGAMVAPFVYPDVTWDFRLPHVASINVSGHKYGLVYPGIGWALWRAPEYLPESMIFYEDYLGTLERTITLNFSRGASQIVAQYYQFLRLGMEGYQKIMMNLTAIAAYVRNAIEGTRHFKIMSKEMGIPLVAFRLYPRFKRLYSENDVSDRMRVDGWFVPSYSMPAGAEEVRLLRVTIREDFSMSMADQFLKSLANAVTHLDTAHAPKPTTIVVR